MKTVEERLAILEENQACGIDMLNQVMSILYDVIDVNKEELIFSEEVMEQLSEYQDTCIDLKLKLKQTV